MPVISITLYSICVNSLFISFVLIPLKLNGSNDILLDCGNAVDVMKTGATVILRNAKIDLFKDTMRVAVDKWGRIEVTDPVLFEVNRDNNLSLVEYELVSVPV